jgi:arsenate reductase-like glutaredoxin family protein
MEIDAMSDDELISAMINEPTLLRRPVIIDGDRLIVGYDRNALRSSFSATDAQDTRGT